jgi:hypothetical protein
MDGLKREWGAVPGLKQLIEGVQKQLNTDTRVRMSEVTIHMIPFTDVRLDMGHQDVVVESEGEDRLSNDAVQLVQIYGFENRVNLGSFAYDGHLKLLLFWSMLATIAVLLLTIALLIPVFW